MTLKEYRRHTTRTQADLGCLKKELSHMALGLVEELEEIKEVLEDLEDPQVRNKEGCLQELGEEMGDFMWYLAEYANLCNMHMAPMRSNISYHEHVEFEFTAEDLVRDLEIQVAKIAGGTKKLLAYGKEFNRDMMSAYLSNICTSMYLLAALPQFKQDMDSILERNILKLKLRYPEKFTEEDALDRKDKKQL